MIRSAAKNHAYVTVVVDPNDYEPVLEAIRQQGGVPFEMRQKLAAKAYARTAAYDSTISNWFAKTLGYNDIPYRGFRRPARRGDALWREPASMGGVLLATASSGPASRRRRSSRASR